MHVIFSGWRVPKREQRRKKSERREKYITILNVCREWELIYYHYWCWRVGGAVLVKTSTGNNFPRKYQRLPRNYYQYWCWILTAISALQSCAGNFSRSAEKALSFSLCAGCVWQHPAAGLAIRRPDNMFAYNCASVPAQWDAVTAAMLDSAPTPCCCWSHLRAQRRGATGSYIGLRQTDCNIISTTPSRRDTSILGRHTPSCIYGKSVLLLALSARFVLLSLFSSLSFQKVLRACMQLLVYDVTLSEATLSGQILENQSFELMMMMMMMMRMILRV